MKPTVALLLGLVLAPLTVNAQRKPPALQNVTISSVQDGDYYSLHVDFDYSGSGTCQCLVKTVQGRKKASFGTIKKCLDKFSMSVSPGRYSVEIKCKSGKNNQQVTVPDVSNCETLEDIDNGSVNITGVTSGSTATYGCNQDYQLKGSATRTCLSDGTWSGMEPTCIVAKEKMCKSLEKFGKQILSTTIGGRCTLSSDCIDMRCQSVRSFGLPNVITITQIHLFPCAKPPAISYKVTSPGIGTIIDGRFNKRKVLSGVVGNTPFEFTIGITKRACGLSVKTRVKVLGRTIHITPPGVESEICMSCDGDCGHPGDIDHGTVDVSGGTMIGDTATYQCDQHFQLNGEDTRTCQDDGTWSGTAPTCQVPVESMCQSLMNMATSLTTTSLGTFGECTVSSDCLSLSCLGLKLVVIPGVVVVDYNSTVTLLPCQTPYGMLLHSTSGNNTIVNSVFAHNTVLSLYDPTRNITTTLIAEMDQKPCGITTSSTACVLGREIVFLPRIDVKMTCVCPTLPDITHGTVTRPDVATVESTARYQCEPTHVLDGPSIRTCQADGTWSGAEPHCETTQETMCATARTAIAGIVDNNETSGQCNLSDDCLTITCSLGIPTGLFTLKFNSTIRLLPGHRPFGIHVQILSPHFSPIVGIFTSTAIATRRFGATNLTVTCEIEQEDHGIILGVKMEILRKTFRVMPPTEIEMYTVCPALDDIQCGTVELSNGYEVGSIATYECNEPLEVNGCPTRVCLQDGTWSGEKPQCEVTSEMMCASMNQVVNRTLQVEGFSGSCDVSDNCTMTDCSLMAVFPLLPPQNIRSRVTFNPCDTPYSFHVVTNVPRFGIAVDEVISESKIVEFKIMNSTGQINFNIVQGCREITISATANILINKVIIIPRSTVIMYCDDSTCK